MRPTTLFILLSLICLNHGCTTYVIGKKATSDGSVMCSHTNDGSGTTDPRFTRVPARDYPDGSLRPIYASPESYPRYVGYDRNVTEYYPENCLSVSGCSEFVPLGFIPQVPHTYAYFETTYGVMNEMQVGIGESTCSGVFAASAIGSGGYALLSVDQLSQIAMERASSAREAVQIMGALAEQYGFYGESTSFEGGSESLMVIDPSEGWVFHILADPTGSSAIWVAARVPDDSVAVVANMFSIREVNLSDTANFLGRADMWAIAEVKGLWAPGQPQDFTATFSDGEYAHKYYSGRRMWGVFNRLAPSAGLPAEYGNLKFDHPYPFAVPVDKPVTTQAAFGVLRDWYEGTNYSTSVGLAGGAFGSPDRFSSNAEDYSVTGNWERTIHLFRSSETFVVQARGWLPNRLGGVIWIGPHAAGTTVYVPITLAVLQSPLCLSTAYQGRYDESTNFWANRNIALLAQAKFSFMIADIRAVQQELESSSEALLASLNTGTWTDDEITAVLTANADKARVAYLELQKKLSFKYADGYINTWVGNKFKSSSAGYPVWWLQSVGFENGPGPASDVNRFGKQAPSQKAVVGESSTGSAGVMSKCLNVCSSLTSSMEMKACAVKCIR